MMWRIRCWLLVALLLPAGVLAQESPAVPTPELFFGYTPGEDRRLANWDELTTYFAMVAVASDRVELDTLGVTTGGRPLVMFTISSPSNLSRLPELRGIQQKLADP